MTKKKQRNRSAVGSESRIKEKCVAHKNKITFEPIYFSLSSAVAAAAASSSCLIWPIFDLVTVSQPARQSWILFIIARFDVIFYSFFLLCSFIAQLLLLLLLVHLFVYIYRDWSFIGNHWLWLGRFLPPSRFLFDNFNDSFYERNNCLTLTILFTFRCGKCMANSSAWMIKYRKMSKIDSELVFAEILKSHWFNRNANECVNHHEYICSIRRQIGFGGQKAIR